MVNTLKNSSRAVSFGHVVLARGPRMVRKTIGWLKKANWTIDWTIELGGGGGETKCARALAQDVGPSLSSMELKTSLLKTYPNYLGSIFGKN